MRIPRFGDDYAVPVLEGTTDEVLAAGFGRFSAGARPGATGNFVTRRAPDHPRRAAAAMPELQPGDEVVVETRKWTYTYVLDTDGDDLTVPFTAGWVLGDGPGESLAAACSPRRSPASDCSP